MYYYARLNSADWHASVYFHPVQELTPAYIHTSKNINELVVALNKVIITRTFRSVYTFFSWHTMQLSIQKAQRTISER